MKAVVAERGQVTIPKSLRDALGIRPGTVLEFEVRKGQLIARKQAMPERMRAARGVLKHLGKSTEQVLLELRGKAE